MASILVWSGRLAATGACKPLATGQQTDSPARTDEQGDRPTREPHRLEGEEGTDEPTGAICRTRTTGFRDAH